jgi:hypothetical protein
MAQIAFKRGNNDDLTQYIKALEESVMDQGTLVEIGDYESLANKRERRFSSLVSIL